MIDKKIICDLCGEEIRDAYYKLSAESFSDIGEDGGVHVHNDDEDKHIHSECLERNQNGGLLEALAERGVLK